MFRIVIAHQSQVNLTPSGIKRSHRQEDDNFADVRLCIWKWSALLWHELATANNAEGGKFEKIPSENK